MKKSLSFLVSMAGLTLMAAGCSPAPIVPNPPAELPPTTPISTSPTPPAVTYPEEATTVRPRPAGTVCDTQNFICVGSQLVNAKIINPLSATGTAIAFENTFQWKLENATHTQLAHGTLMASAPDIGLPGPFTLMQTIPGLVPGTYTLTFFESSARDGSPVHSLVIPMEF